MKIRQSTSSSSLKRRWLFRVAALCLGLLLAGSFAEIALRFAGIGFPSFYAPDAHCGSRLRASTSGVWITEGHGDVAINTLGFRGPEISVKKPAAVFRIAVLGDSFVEALQVNVDETFCAQLQSKLNFLAGSSGTRYEVINCAVAGYGTAQELLMLRHYVMPLDPDLILLSVFPHNDVRNNSFKLAYESTVPYFVLGESGELELDNSFLKSPVWLTANTAYEQTKATIVNSCRLLQVLKQAKLVLSSTRSGSVSKSVPDQLQALIDEAIYAYRPTDDPDQQLAWRVTESLIREIAAECESHQTPLAVFTASSPVQVHPDHEVRQSLAARNGIADLFYADKRLSEVCRQASIRFHPLASRMLEELAGQTVYYHGFANVGMGLGHWNENGHATAARLMANFLERERLLLKSTSNRSNPG